MDKLRKRTKKDYCAAILAARGLISHAAATLGVSTRAIYNMAARHPEVRAAIDEAREQTLDLAENMLFENIKKGDNTAIIFYLKTIGRHRGYIERIEHANITLTELEQMTDEQLEALAAKVGLKPRMAN
jgi:hypothetical protein